MKHLTGKFFIKQTVSFALTIFCQGFQLLSGKFREDIISPRVYIWIFNGGMHCSALPCNRASWVGLLHEDSLTHWMRDNEVSPVDPWLIINGNLKEQSCTHYSLTQSTVPSKKKSSSNNSWSVYSYFVKKPCSTKTQRKLTKTSNF